MTESRHLKTKICLIGDHAVGKTSLIRRFVADTFDDRYLMTLGTKVSKKVVDLALPRQNLAVRVDMGIWDIMGQHGLLNLLNEAYFTGANGILAVLDLTRRSTLETFGVWIRSVEKVAGRIPALIAVNKYDLAPRAEFALAEVEQIAAAQGCDFLTTSAKTGENVENAFQHLAILVAEHLLRSG